MKVGILCSRIRAEEKLLFAAMQRRQIDAEAVDDRKLVLEISQDRQSMAHYAKYDVIVARSISHSRALYGLQILNDCGIPTVNTAQVARICGDKLQTTSVLTSAGIPSPRTLIAYTPSSALDAVEEIGYPAVVKPVTGSWGRLLSKFNDRESAEAVLEHKHMLGADHHDIYYIQEYVQKPMRDIRAFIIGGKTLCAIYRSAPHWVTNTARGGQSSNCPITPEIDTICQHVSKAVGGGILAVDLLEDPVQGLLVNEVNDIMEFRNSIRPTGVDIPDHMVDFIEIVAQDGWTVANQFTANRL